jgi:hypothetical protein
MDRPFTSDRFPRSLQYDPEWIVAGVGGGDHSLWLTEWLTENQKTPILAEETTVLRGLRDDPIQPRSGEGLQ